MGRINRNSISRKKENVNSSVKNQRIFKMNDSGHQITVLF